MKRVLALLLLTGCPKTVTPTGPVWSSTPRLPAPIGGAYTRSRDTPSDPALAAFVKGKPWDVTLSGAAAGIALQLVGDTGGPGLTRWRVREALWRAGYPFPATDARAWPSQPGGAPSPELEAWLASFPEGDDLGLVRARGDQIDVWVGLRATPGVDLGRVGRQVPDGGSIALPKASGATYTVSDANGHVQTGTLDEPAVIQTNTVGEWMVEVRSEGLPTALFPVYVGMVPPEIPLIREVAPVSTPVEVLERTESLLGEVREIYGARALQRDFMLDAGARSLLTADSTSAAGVKASLDLDPAGTMLFECRGTTVEACIDAVIWKPAHRLALLADESALGLAADLDARGAHVVGIVSVTH